MQILNTLILPKVKDSCSKMYFKGKKVSFTENSLEIEDKGEVSFNTYFNLFEHTLYQNNTDIKSVNFNFDIQGEATITLWHSFMDQEWYDKLWLKAEHSHKIKRQKLVTYNKEGKNRELCSIPLQLIGLMNKGFVYAQIQAKTKCTIFSGQVTTIESPKNDIRLAVTICTFKREKYVLSNAKNIIEYITKNNLQEHIQLNIIDNGKTLPPMEGANILPNKNLGGSGGFTRGMIESVQNDCTHCLLMDDDIEFEPEVLARTYTLLQNLKSADTTIIGGSILVLKKPIQWAQKEYLDVSQCWIQEYIPSKINLDFESSLHMNTFDYKNDNKYLAWPYACFPTTCFKRHGFALPFFIKWDDIDFGLRQKEYNYVYANGLGVWHESFESIDKYNPILAYYAGRNRLISNLIEKKDNLSNLQNAIKIIVTDCLIRQKYDEAENFLQGFEDVLKGVQFFLEEKEEYLFAAKKKFNFKKYTKDELFALGYDIDSLKNGIENNAILITFHLCVPNMLSKSLPNIHYDFEENVGFITTFDEQRELDLITRLQNLIKNFIKKYADIQQEYKKLYPYMISASSWEKILDLPRQEKAHFARENFMHIAYFINSKEAFYKIYDEIDSLYAARIRPVFLTENEELFKIWQTSNIQSHKLPKIEAQKNLAIHKIFFENDIQIVHTFIENSISWIQNICNTLGCAIATKTSWANTTELIDTYDTLCKNSIAVWQNPKKVTAVLIADGNVERRNTVLEMLQKQTFQDFNIIVVEKAQLGKKQEHTLDTIFQEYSSKIAHSYYAVDSHYTQAEMYKYALAIARLNAAEWIYVVSNYAQLTQESLQKLVNASLSREDEVSFVSSNIQVEPLQQEKYCFSTEKINDKDITSTSFNSVLINSRAIALFGLPLKIFKNAYADREYTLRLSMAFGNGIVVAEDYVNLVNLPKVEYEQLKEEYCNRLFIAKAYFGKQGFEIEKKHLLENNSTKLIQQSKKLSKKIPFHIFKARFDINLNEDAPQKSKLDKFKLLVPKAFRVLRRDGLKIFVKKTLFYLKHR